MAYSTFFSRTPVLLKETAVASDPKKNALTSIGYQGLFYKICRAFISNLKKNLTKQDKDFLMTGTQLFFVSDSLPMSVIASKEWKKLKFCQDKLSLATPALRCIRARTERFTLGKFKQFFLHDSEKHAANLLFSLKFV